MQLSGRINCTSLVLGGWMCVSRKSSLIMTVATAIKASMSSSLGDDAKIKMVEMVFVPSDEMR